MCTEQVSFIPCEISTYSSLPVNLYSDKLMTPGAFADDWVSDALFTCGAGLGTLICANKSLMHMNVVLDVITVILLFLLVLRPEETLWRDIHEPRVSTKRHGTSINYFYAFGSLKLIRQLLSIKSKNKKIW